MYTTKKNNYLMHHGVKGMKWGVRRYEKRQKTYKQAAEKAKRFMEYSNETKTELNKMQPNKRRQITNSDIKRWKKVAATQKTEYNKLYKKYSQTPVDQITKKDYKSAKRFVKSARFEEAYYTDIFYDNKDDNYQLSANYNFETGKFKKK